MAQVAPRSTVHDVVIIGSGAGGGTVTKVLADLGVKVLLMSGFNEQEAVHKFIGKGLAGFVQKPFRLEDLRDAVRKLLDIPA